MTAYEIINKGFGLAGEQLDMYPDKNIALIWLNIALGESMDAENHIRVKNGLSTLAEAVVVLNLSDEVDISHCICAVALPYAVASCLAGDREDGYMAAIYRNRFITSLQDCAKGHELPVTDVYGGGV